MRAILEEALKIAERCVNPDDRDAIVKMVGDITSMTDALCELDPRKVFDKLYAKYHIAGAGMGPNVRLSPHIYNTLDEADRAVNAVAEILRDGV